MATPPFPSRNQQAPDYWDDDLKSYIDGKVVEPRPLVVPSNSDGSGFTGGVEFGFEDSGGPTTHRIVESDEGGFTLQERIEGAWADVFYVLGGQVQFAQAPGGLRPGGTTDPVFYSTSNCNEATGPGWYSGTGSAANAPFNGNFILLASPDYGNSRVQQFGFDGDGGRIFTRSRAAGSGGGVWSAWSQMPTGRTTGWRDITGALVGSGYSPTARDILFARRTDFDVELALDPKAIGINGSYDGLVGAQLPVSLWPSDIIPGVSGVSSPITGFIATPVTTDDSSQAGLFIVAAEGVMFFNPDNATSGLYPKIGRMQFKTSAPFPTGVLGLNPQ